MLQVLIYHAVKPMNVSLTKGWRTLPPCNLKSYRFMRDAQRWAWRYPAVKSLILPTYLCTYIYPYYLSYVDVACRKQMSLLLFVMSTKTLPTVLGLF